MKRIAFVSRRKMVAQGLEAALLIRPKLSMELLPLIPPLHAVMDLAVYEPDIAVLDITGDMAMEEVDKICSFLRREQPSCRLLLLVPEDESRSRVLPVSSRQQGLSDDFVFYDSSMDYLLAKLAAL